MIIGSTSLALIMTFIFENQLEFDNQAKVIAWAQNLTHVLILPTKG